MIVSQQETTLYGHPSIWQVLLEYEHTEKEAVPLMGFRLEYEADPAADSIAWKPIPVEVLHYSVSERAVLDRVCEALGRRRGYERYFKNATPLERGEVVQVRAKFPSSSGRVNIILF